MLEGGREARRKESRKDRRREERRDSRRKEGYERRERESNITRTSQPTWDCPRLSRPRETMVEAGWAPKSGADSRHQ